MSLLVLQPSSLRCLVNSAKRRSTFTRSLLPTWKLSLSSSRSPRYEVVAAEATLILVLFCFLLIFLDWLTDIFILSAEKAKIHYTSFTVASPQHVGEVFTVVSLTSPQQVVSVASCRFPNSITSICCQIATDLLATRRTILIVCCVLILNFL